MSAKSAVISLLSMKENPGLWRYRRGMEGAWAPRPTRAPSVTTGSAWSLIICVVLGYLYDFYESLLLHF